MLVCEQGVDLLGGAVGGGDGPEGAGEDVRGEEDREEQTQDLAAATRKAEGRSEGCACDPPAAALRGGWGGVGGWVGGGEGDTWRRVGRRFWAFLGACCCRMDSDKVPLLNGIFTIRLIQTRLDASLAWTASRADRTAICQPLASSAGAAAQASRPNSPQRVASCPPSHELRTQTFPSLPPLTWSMH